MEFKSLKYSLSRIITSRNEAQKNCITQFSNFFGCFFFLIFGLKTCGTMKMFPLSAQTHFFIILSSYVEEHVKKNSSLSFISLVGLENLKGKFTVELV